MFYYCMCDVEILARGCEIFQKSFKESTEIDPFQHVTIASACTAYYQTILPEDTIALFKDRGEDKYSIESIKWLTYISEKHNIPIQHALNGGEKTIDANNRPYKVDA